MKKIILFAGLLLFSPGCTSPGNNGQFGAGRFYTSCELQVPSICDMSPMPHSAVGTTLDIRYDPDTGNPDGEVFPVSEKLFTEPAWSAFFAGDSEHIYDYTTLTSEEISSLDIVSVSDFGEETVDEPIVIGCTSTYDDLFIVPRGTTRKLMGIGEWQASVTPDLADVFFEGNSFSFDNNNTTGETVDAVLTITLRSTDQSWDVDLRICTVPTPAEDVEEAVEVPEEVEEEEAGDAVEGDVVEEDPAQEEPAGEVEDDAPAEVEDVSADDAMSEEGSDA
jgi:hypothetical protein